MTLKLLNHRAIASVLILFSPVFVWLSRAQYAAVLTQKQEGSATVYASAPDGLAYIVDGGKPGTLTVPHLDGKPVLRALFDKKYRDLVIVCSHPHADHAQGLQEIIRSDPYLEAFSRIRFVDSGYPQSESLFQLFKTLHPKYSGTAEYFSALNKNAFAEFSHAGKAVHFANFVYEPASGASEHGHSIISIATLSRDGIPTRIVDFDDADSYLVKRWVEWASVNPALRRPDVIIMPHHGSDLTDIDPLLTPSIRPKACVISVNSNNRYSHPGALNYLKLVKALGVKNVHVTGAGQDIEIDYRGLKQIASSDRLHEIYTAIIKPNLAKLESNLKEPSGNEADPVKQAALLKVEEAYLAEIATQQRREAAQRKAAEELAAVRKREAEEKAAALQQAERQRAAAEQRATQQRAAAERRWAAQQAAAERQAAARQQGYGGAMQASCQIQSCSEPSVGRCSIRGLYVCEKHRVFTMDGITRICP